MSFACPKIWSWSPVRKTVLRRLLLHHASVSCDETLFICCLCVFAFFAVFHVRMCSSTFDVSVFVPFIFELFRFSQRFLVNCLFYFFITLPLAFEAFSKLEEFVSDFFDMFYESSPLMIAVSNNFSVFACIWYCLSGHFRAGLTLKNDSDLVFRKR